jgi:coenzyme Q-binding protein COQ10
LSQIVLETEKRLPYAPDDLCRLVGDVRSYPKFIPWLKHLRILREKPHDDGGWEGAAEAIVGWKAITETFSTSVRSEPVKGEVDVGLLSGPFRSLLNRWRFKSDGDGGAIVKFYIAAEFKNPVLQAVFRSNKERVAARIMQAFEAEAHRRFKR